MADRDKYFKEAYNQLQLISQDESKRWEYEEREKRSVMICRVNMNMNSAELEKAGQRTGKRA